MNKVFYHWGTAANTLQIFKMSSHKEKWNIEVTLRFAFSHFMEVLLYTLKWLEFEIYKVIFVVSSVLEIINQKKKILSPWFLEFWQLLATPLTRFCLEVETNLKKKKVLYLLINGHSFPRNPKKWKSSQRMQVVTSQEENLNSHCEWEK